MVSISHRYQDKGSKSTWAANYTHAVSNSWFVATWSQNKNKSVCSSASAWQKKIVILLICCSCVCLWLAACLEKNGCWFIAKTLWYTNYVLNFSLEKHLFGCWIQNKWLFCLTAYSKNDDSFPALTTPIR